MNRACRDNITTASAAVAAAMVWTGIEVYYTPGSPNCRAVLMCIRELGIDVDLVKLDMYQKYEHKRPWFVKVRKYAGIREKTTLTGGCNPKNVSLPLCKQGALVFFSV